MNRPALALLLAFAVAGCGSPSKEIVLVYSPHGPDILKDYEKMFEEAYPWVDMQWLDMGSQQVYNKVSAESRRPACDIWWGAPSYMFKLAADQGLFDAYRPSWSDRVGANDKDPENLWHGTHYLPLSILFNDNEYAIKDVPQTWDELLDEKWHGKISIRKPLDSGTMRTFIGASIMRAGNEDAGVEWLAKLHNSTKAYLETPQLLFDHIKRNKEVISVWIMPDAVMQRERNGYPFGFFMPPNTPVITEGIAIIKNAPHREWAEKFFDFVTTHEALIQQAETYAKIPARDDIDPAALPAWMVEQPIDAMAIDWKAFSENEQAWCARWEKEVYDAS
jgi:iron(III) transport system substrate-binding protein